MGRLLDLAKSVENSLHSRFGNWMLHVSETADETATRVSEIDTIIAGEVSALAGPGLVPNGTELAVGQNPDGSIVVNNDDIQVSAAIQSGAAAGAAAAPIVTGSRISSNGGFAFITQNSWFVNATTGNDANNGDTALTALRTLGELTRRLNAQVLDPTMATLTITLDGVFTQGLDLHFDSPGPTNITVQGTMAAASFTGTIDTYTAFNPAGGVRASILDAGIVDFTPFKQFRIRVTTGAANNGLTSFTSVVALTTANIGQLYTNTMPETATVVNAANGDGYVVENWATSAPGFNIAITGRGSCVVRDMLFVPAAATSLRNAFTCGGSRIRARFFGCKFDCTNGFICTGMFAMIACVNTGGTAMSFDLGHYQQQGACVFNAMQMNGICAGLNNMHDGDGLRSVCLSVNAAGYLGDSNHRAFFGCINGAGFTTLALMQGGGLWDMSGANARFWGAAGNTTTSAAQVQNSGGMLFNTLPTATGNVPGNDLVLAGAAPIAWAAAAAGAVAAAPNNAYALLRQ